MWQTQARFGMRRLPAPGKWRSGRWHALVIVGIALSAFVVLGWFIWRHRIASAAGMMGVAAWQMIMAFSMRGRRLRAPHLVDEVWVDGGGLLVNRKDESERMPLANVASVVTERYSDLVTLQLSLPCAFGDQVGFIARRGSGRDIGVELRQRIAEARQAA